MSSLIGIIRLSISQALIRVSSSVIINRLQTTLTNVLQLLKLHNNLLPPSNPYKTGYRGILLLGDSSDGRTMLIENYIILKNGRFIYDPIVDKNDTIKEYTFSKSVETGKQNFHLINMPDGITDFSKYSHYFINSKYIMLSFAMNFKLQDDIKRTYNSDLLTHELNNTHFNNSSWTSNLQMTKDYWLQNNDISNKPIIILVNLFGLKIRNQGTAWNTVLGTNPETGDWKLINATLKTGEQLTINQNIALYNNDVNNENWGDSQFLERYNISACNAPSFMNCVNEFKQFVSELKNVTRVSLAFVSPNDNFMGLVSDPSATTLYYQHTCGIEGGFFYL